MMFLAWVYFAYPVVQDFPVWFRLCGFGECSVALNLIGGNMFLLYFRGVDTAYFHGGTHGSGAIFNQRAVVALRF